MLSKKGISIIIEQIRIKHFNHFTRSSKQYHHIIQDENLRIVKLVQLVINKLKLIILKIELDLPSSNFTKLDILRSIESKRCTQKIRIFLGVGFKEEIENKVSFMENIQNSSEYYFLLLRALDM